MRRATAIQGSRDLPDRALERLALPLGHPHGAGSAALHNSPPRIAYLMSRFPKLTETFVLYEMRAVEDLGARIELYPLRREPGTILHEEATRWVGRAHFDCLHPVRIARANIAVLIRQPVRYLTTLVRLLWHTLGSPRYFAGGLVFFPRAVGFAGQMQREGVGHVHAHFASHPAAAAWVIHRLTGIPYSFTAHGSDLHCDRHMLREKVADAEFVIAISEYNRRVILETCGSGVADRVHVVHCGVDTGAFRPRDGAPDAKRGPARAILCIGILHPVKGQTYLIEACRLLAQRGVPFTCDFVGDGPDLAKLARQAEQAGIADRVHFRGRLTQEEIRDILRLGDVVAAPSVPTRDGRREGIPVVLMEAMASGVPVVASRLSGIPELVEDGKTGLLIEPGDARGLALTLERLLGDPALRGRLGAAGRTKVEREFDLRGSAVRLMSRFQGMEAH